MSTRSSVRNLLQPLDNLELTIRRRSRVDPTLLNDFEFATNENGDLPVLDLQIMKELCQPTLNGRHLDKFLHVTQSIKVNGVIDDAFRLYLFPYSLTHHATAWFDRLPRNSINTFEKMAKMFLGKYFPPSMVMKLRNEITNFRQRPNESLFEAWERYKISIDRCPDHNMLPVTQIDTFYNGLTLRHRDTINAAAGGTFMKRPIVGQTQNVYVAGAYHGGNSYQPQVEHETEVTKDTVPPTNNGSTTDVQPLGVQVETSISNFEPAVAPVIEPVVALISAPKPNQKPSIPYPSRLHDQKLRDKANDQKEKFFQIFQDLNFNISFADALILMPKRSFLKTRRALIDVYEGELILRVGKAVVTFNLDQTLRYSANYNDMTANRIDVIDMAFDAFLSLEDDPISSGLDHSYYDTERDIILLEAFLNDDPSLPPLTQGIKPSLGNSDIKGINPEFYTHKILMEDDFKPTVQHQRMVIQKIHEVIKKEVLKLLDVGLIYPISNSSWVSPVHCVPKKGGFTVVENEENKLIPTRLVTGWHVCIEYRKLNETTRKDHFLLPFMDQMLERLAGNEYYCFLDGFSGYFQISIDPKDQEKPTFRGHYRRFPTVACLSGCVMHRARSKGV
nr:reverse transcriptase domain-containing protein [Tanacetum cinerariifolium]